MRSDDFRYHIASLAAVFFALGIGILIGTAFVGAPVVERQIRALNRTLSTSVNELDRRREEAEKNEEALRALLPGLVQGKLLGRRVLVVRTGDFPDAAVQTRVALELAGARVAEITLPVDEWQRVIVPETSPPAGSVTETSALPPAARDLERLARALVRPARPDAEMPADIIASLGQRDLVRGDASVSPVSLVVVVGGAKPPPGPPPSARTGAAASSGGDSEARRRTAARAETIDLLNRTLARTWTDENDTVSAVGVAPLEADPASLRAFGEADLATVDNIDRAAGQIALPFALLGEKAAYGMKAGSERVLPASLSERRPAATLPSPPAPSTLDPAEATPARHPARPHGPGRRAVSGGVAPDPDSPPESVAGRIASPPAKQRGRRARLRRDSGVQRGGPDRGYGGRGPRAPQHGRRNRGQRWFDRPHGRARTRRRSPTWSSTRATRARRAPWKRAPTPSPAWPCGTRTTRRQRSAASRRCCCFSMPIWARRRARRPCSLTRSRAARPTSLSPPSRWCQGRGGGRGIVVRLSRWGIRRATGRTMIAPLSGQRCLTLPAFAAARPLARGFGVETAMTIDVLRAGYRLVEVPTQMDHRVTGNDWTARRHRLRQLRDVARALVPRLLFGRLRGRKGRS
jgi:hypothetical protein